MRREQADFGANFRRHLVLEQRRAILEMLARQEIDQQATVGDVIAAAESLGWGDNLGDLNLSELAEALLPPVEVAGSAARSLPEAEADDEDDDDDDDDEAEEEEEEEDVAPATATAKKVGRRGAAGRASKKQAATKKQATKKKAAKVETQKAANKKTAKKAGQASSKKSASKAAAKPAKTASKAAAKAGARAGQNKARLRALLRKLDADEPMSLEEAAEALVPVVQEYGEATMQQLEEATGIGRRKLRFHIGQLVRYEYLERHGMGRGTCYTVA